MPAKVGQTRPLRHRLVPASVHWILLNIAASHKELAWPAVLSTLTFPGKLDVPGAEASCKPSTQVPACTDCIGTPTGPYVWFLGKHTEEVTETQAEASPASSLTRGEENSTQRPSKDVWAEKQPHLSYAQHAFLGIFRWLWHQDLCSKEPCIFNLIWAYFLSSSRA